MRRVFPILALLCVVSCNKQADIPARQEVTFGAHLVDASSMTRAVNHSEVLSYLQTLQPSNVSPKFYKDGDRSVTKYVPLGQAVTMDVGHYEVEWENAPKLALQTPLDVCGFSTTPKYRIATEVDIVPGVTQYSLPVGIASSGFVVDYGEVASVRVTNLAQSLTDASAAFVKRGDFGITFFSGDFTDNCVTVQVRPVDTTAAEAVTFRFTWDGADYKGNPTYKMEPGKYYVLHPDAVTELEGLFALEFAEWSCGME